MTLSEAELEEARKVLGLSGESSTGDTSAQDEYFKSIKSGTVAAGTLIKEGYSVDQFKDEFPYYSPGTGLLYRYPGMSTGTAEQPHKPIELVPVDELAGDPAKFTAAPNTDAV